MPHAVGIDLGTAKSVVAALRDGVPVVIPNSEGARATPSVVAYAPDGRVLVGEAAKRQAVTNPGRTIQSVKRLMGTAETVDIDGRRFTPQEVSARILRKLKGDAEAYLNDTVTQAVIAVPAQFTDAQRTATKEAAQIAGLELLRIISEPSAATLAYGFERDDGTDQNVLMVDLGAGHLSVQVTEVGEGVYDVKSVSGDIALGGNDWDQFIVDWLAVVHGFGRVTDPTAIQRLTEAAEKARIELSQARSASISLPFLASTSAGSTHLDETLSRSTFESFTAKLVERCRKPIEAAVKDAGLAWGDIDHVVLVGGATRMPAVTAMVESVAGTAATKSVNREEAVARGAAIQAGILKGTVKDVLLQDVVPLSIGIETKGGLMHKLIGRNTTIPTRRTEVFTTAEDNQATVEIHVLQGESETVEDNTTLGKFTLDDLPPAAKGVPQIEVTFDMDANGILHVSAKDSATSREQSSTVTGRSALTRDDFERMLADADAEVVIGWLFPGDDGGTGPRSARISDGELDDLSPSLAPERTPPSGALGPRPSGEAGMDIAVGLTAHDVARHPFGVGSHASIRPLGETPFGYLIKGNVRRDGSRRYHRPDSTAYGTTKADYWFDSPAAAEAAGFTLAASHPVGSDPAHFEPGGPGNPYSRAAVGEVRITALYGPGGPDPSEAADSSDSSDAGDTTELVPTGAIRPAERSDDEVQPAPPEPDAPVAAPTPVEAPGLEERVEQLTARLAELERLVTGDDGRQHELLVLEQQSKEVRHPPLVFDELTVDRLQDQGVLVTSEILDNCLSALAQGKPLLLVGPPGTGKTTLARALARSARVGSDPPDLVEVIALPSWDDEELVGRPQPDGHRTVFRYGPLLAALSRGITAHPTWLLIDELNRAYPDMVLIPLFEWLTALPDADLRVSYAVGDRQPRITTPSSFRLICAMNDADALHLFALSESLLNRFRVVRMGHLDHDREVALLHHRAARSHALVGVGPALDGAILAIAEVLREVRRLGTELGVPRLHIGSRYAVQILDAAVPLLAPGVAPTEALDRAFLATLIEPLRANSRDVLERLVADLFDQSSFPRSSQSLLATIDTDAPWSG